MPHDRSTFIGGSDISAILGISPWKSPVELWLEKTQPVVAEADGANAVALRRGKRLEPYMLDMIVEEHGLDIIARNQRYVDAEHEFFSCEVDAETRDENVELKTVHPFKAQEWSADDDGVPLHYAAQCMWGLGIRKRQRCHVFALIGDELRQYVIERDDDTIAALRDRALNFWQQYVIPRVQPPLVHEDPRALDSLRRLYPGTDGSTVIAPPDLHAWRAVYEESCERAKRYTAAADAAKAHLLDAMGNAALLKFEDGKSLRRKLVSKKAYTINVPASSYVDARFVNAKDNE